MSKTVGIDLGTTYSLVAHWRDGRPEVIPNAEGSRLTPSVVSFLQDGSYVAGQPARLYATINPRDTIFSIKRHMGSDHRVKVGHREYTPQEISALILKKVKEDAEAYLGERIDRAVITVPAYFNARQRQATREAGILAGLEVMRLLDEPTASALAYGLDLEAIHTILVWDLGGGTFDVSILELGEGVFEVRAVNGDAWLGGDDYDQHLTEYLALRLQRQLGVDLHQDPVAWQSLRQVAERAKIELTDQEVVEVLFSLPDRSQGLRTWQVSLSRAQFEAITGDLRQRMVPPTLNALADAGLGPGDIDRVILVGGASRMPAIPQLLHQLLGKEPYAGLNPDEAVTLGAAIQAGILTGEIPHRVLISVTPLSLGLEAEGGIFARIIPRNTPIPTRHSQVFTNAADFQASLDIHILQGERPLARDNVSLGRFELPGLPALPRGRARVEVTFSINSDGILEVSATDLLTDSVQKVHISPRFYGLSPEEPFPVEKGPHA